MANRFHRVLQGRHRGGGNFYFVFAVLQTLSAGEKKAYTALLQCGTCLCRKKRGPLRKISVVDMVFLVFTGVFVSTTGLPARTGAPARRGVGVPAHRGVGVPARRRVGVPARGVLQPVRGSRSVRIPRAGYPH